MIKKKIFYLRIDRQMYRIAIMDFNEKQQRSYWDIKRI